MSITYTECIECRRRIPAGTGGRCSSCALPARKIRRTGAWRELSRAVRSRGICDLCGGAVPPEQLEAHHRIALALRPDLAYDPGNVIAACRPCHDAVPRPAGRRSRSAVGYNDRLTAWLEMQRAARSRQRSS